MPIEYYNHNDFMKRISNTKELSLVFGSALTGLKDDIGILQPPAIVEFIKERMNAEGYSDDFNRHMELNHDVNPYQAAFEFVAKFYGVDGINSIITDIVKLNEDPKTGRQKIPSNVRSLVQAIKKGKLNVKYIITTNFDTIIEEALAEEGILCNSPSVVSDSNISDNANKLITIVHIHGVWNHGDTMHTRNQLENKRGKIEESLRNIIESGPLCVMAYGAWEDSFTRSLTNILKNNLSTYSLIWCFYAENAGTIDRESKHIINMLEDAISRERVQFYKGIDCRSIFSDINAEVNTSKKH